MTQLYTMRYFILFHDSNHILFVIAGAHLAIIGSCVAFAWLGPKY